MSFEPHSHYHFDDFDLDVENRQLWYESQQLDLNGRYFDALVLLVHQHGQLVEKDQFFSEVWGDVVVSDSALTQCIKDIRKQLGDNASNPRYIQTVPGYGYRFIGRVEANPSAEPGRNKSATERPRVATSSPSTQSYQLKQGLHIGGMGAIGGITAGLLGGLFYGFGLAYAPSDTTMGATSMLLVLTSLNVIIGGMGGLGVSSGMAAAIISTGGNKIWTVIGAAFGGLVIGSLAKLLVVDALTLLFGTAPEGITGGLEGAVLGAAVALGAMFGGGLNATHRIRPVVAAATASGIAGVLITISGGHLMSGSLDLLTRSFTGSHLRLDAFGRFFGEINFGLITQTVLAGVEGFLFGACVVGAIVYLKKQLSFKD
ncbi:winged helix-turn-helix domain-containing protein [Fodinibius salsisoli]|uniref:Winged helix-turn-helix domain-containing protein n=1 Tax=Fodinibius salsisoli TaxID=2820877 RepID=A0ABT3PMZ8_9BACT|nr:winged helix-turn-helix domain-containing protein [Fodinibius salsisoli]MCW9707279.1 winged helix-turn-helix domain-containing protein [Fodinibius salsisoli]